MSDWLPAREAPEGQVVMTKIDDAEGVRNEGTLKRRDNLWWTPDGEMYVYYRPTHYRLLTADETATVKQGLAQKAAALRAAADRLDTTI